MRCQECKCVTLPETEEELLERLRVGDVLAYPYRTSPLRLAADAATSLADLWDRLAEASDLLFVLEQGFRARLTDQRAYRTPLRLYACWLARRIGDWPALGEVERVAREHGSAAELRKIQNGMAGALAACCGRASEVEKAAPS